MTLHEFLAHALKPEIYVRKGQRFMNMLRVHRPDLEEQIAGTENDPFYVDELLWTAVEWVKDNWGEEDR